MFLNKALLLYFPLLTQGVYVPGTPGAPWSQQEILDVKAKMRMIFKNPWGPMQKALEILGYPPETYNTDRNSGGIYGSYRIPTAPKFLRLSFHDCVKYEDGTGGCDGCLDWEGVGVMFDDAPNKKQYEDVKFTNNNGLRPTVEMLEAIYTTPDFPIRSPILSQSLKDSGKSRADLWALAAIVAVEWGVETNNFLCANASDTYMNGAGECHHLLGEEGCEVNMDKPIPFHTGRSDCEVSDPARPYVASKKEVHPNAVGSGYDTMEFFQSQFGLNGQETVALLGAHTFGRLFIMNSLFRYTWTSAGTRLFNNDYFKMVTDKQRWFFNDPGVCTKVGDAHGNKPQRRWLTHFRSDTKNGGPVHWISESYVCPNCVKGKEPWWSKSDEDCCNANNIPSGKFCMPDEKSLDEKVVSKGEQDSGCERWRFVMGVDEMALPAEMGLYFDFNQTDGFPTGCPGFDNFHGGEGSRHWSSDGWARSDTGCEKQLLAIPSTDKPTSWYMEEYARDQNRWIKDFSDAMEKMMANGYDMSDLVLAGQDLKAVSCTPRQNDQWFSQCWEKTDPEGDEFIIESQLDGRVIQVNEDTGKAEMWERIDGNVVQQWRWNGDKTQLINSKNGQLLNVDGLVMWTLGEPNNKGYSSLSAKGMDWNGEPRVMDRGWTRENGINFGTYKEHKGPNQMFKLTKVVSVDACETESKSSFSIENKKTGKALTMDPTTGVVTASQKIAGATNQLWKWSESCELTGRYLINVETGTFLGVKVTESKEIRDGNSWVYDEENGTLKSSAGYAREFKRKKMGMAGNTRLNKRTKKPWDWFRWNLVEN